MGSPRDITGGLTGWSGRSALGRPSPKRPSAIKKKKKSAGGSKAEEAALFGVRATDYFTIFVYSLVVVSLIAQGGIMLSLSVF